MIEHTFIFHTIALSAALYFAFPFMQSSCTAAVFFGVGTLTSIFWPKSVARKLDLRTIFTSSFCREISRTKGTARNGKEMSYKQLKNNPFPDELFKQTFVVRYFIRSNSPSGGIKLIARSDSNFDKRTHWWNVQSSIAIAVFFSVPDDKSWQPFG